MPEQRAGLIRYTRMVEYRVNFTSGVLAGCSIHFIATDSQLKEPHLRALEASPATFHGWHGLGIHYLPVRLPGEEQDLDLIQEFGMACVQHAGADGAALMRFLRGSDVRVPVFGSPPQSWTNLDAVIAQAVGGFAAIGIGENLPTFLLAYTGGVVLVHFVNPVVAEAGRAVADGVGARIRKAFGLSETPNLDPVGTQSAEIEEGDSWRVIDPPRDGGESDR
ncbi:hypothetical protein OG613_01055 [Streptomyces sp. NBC_00015]|uniref:hypothetical protein n=1 Tax=Streptomyces sp. NBC_00015 TaxID=2903611 RepID=UPI00324E0F3D